MEHRTLSFIRTPAAHTAEQRRIVLVDLFWTRDKDPRVPLGHAALLSALRSEAVVDVRSVVIPVNSKGRPRPVATRILRAARGLPDARVDIAIGAYIWNEGIVQRLLPRLRSRGFGGRIILGGPQVSYVESGLEALYPQADVFIRGHAETALHAVALTSKRVDVPGVHYAGQADLARQASAGLDSLSSPLLDGTIGLQGQRFLRWETRRGCQFRCSFCQHRQKDAQVKLAAFPAARIDREIDLICRSDVDDLAVLDPVFNTDDAHAVRVLRRFAQNGFRGRISLQCRAEFVSDDFLDAAKQLDVCLEFGLQTVHRNEQLAIDRPNNLTRVEEALAKVREREIDHEVSLIFGLPEQTLDSFKESVRWCLERQVPVIKAFPLLLLRGTRLDVERDRWAMKAGGDTMPVVLSSSSFTRQERDAMEAISQALSDTEGAHPPLDALLDMAHDIRIDRARFQPQSNGRIL
jgi:radical SAM superfamily enzyme YgiQ (UPF0313 family)